MAPLYFEKANGRRRLLGHPLLSAGHKACDRLARLTVEENAAIMNMHFRRKPTAEKSKFPSGRNIIYANA
jgi:hypothetical protein